MAHEAHRVEAMIVGQNENDIPRRGLDKWTDQREENEEQNLGAGRVSLL